MRFVSHTLLIALFIVFCLGLINLVIRLAPEERPARRVDCSLAEFHPDFTNEMRNACREHRSAKP
jgi:hypothetical protein